MSALLGHGLTHAYWALFTRISWRGPRQLSLGVPHPPWVGNKPCTALLSMIARVVVIATVDIFQRTTWSIPNVELVFASDQLHQISQYNIHSNIAAFEHKSRPLHLLLRYIPYYMFPGVEQLWSFLRKKLPS